MPPPRPRIKPVYSLRLASSTIRQCPTHSVKVSPLGSRYPKRYVSSSATNADLLPSLPSRWYSDLRARIGKCIMFGCTRAQAQRAAAILRILGTEWRELTAGAEGFLTGGRRGLENQQVVWGEMDSFGHVNNANYIRYAESARVNWIIHFASVDPGNGTRWRELMTPKGTGLIMKSIKAEYKFPMTYPDSISAYHKLRTKPSPTDTSLVLDCVILSHRHRRVAARTEEDVAVYDYAAARKTAVPAFALAGFMDVWKRQEAQTLKSRGKIWQLMKSVEALENETWNRKDAVEDWGGKTVGKEEVKGVKGVKRDDEKKGGVKKDEAKKESAKGVGEPSGATIGKVRPLF